MDILLTPGLAAVFASFAVGVVALLALLGFAIRRASRETRQRLFAHIWSRLSHGTDSTLRARKAALLQDVHGAVVEIGPGVGSSLRYLSPRRITSLLLAEPNTFMHTELAAAAAKAGFSKSNGLVVCAASGEALPVPPASQDFVLCTLVLCSIPAAALRSVLDEAERVLRPGGRFVFLEHVAADPSTQPLRAVTQRFAMATGLWSALGDGCELTRDTAGLLRAVAAGTGGASGAWRLELRDVLVPIGRLGLCSRGCCCGSRAGVGSSERDAASTVAAVGMSLLGGTQIEGSLVRLSTKS